MKISFSTKGIHSLCTSHDKAVRKYGRYCADGLFTRLTQLNAADKLKYFIFDRPHPLKGSKAGKFAVTIYGGWRLIFEPHNSIPKSEDDSIDWDNVIDIKITSIEDYHK